MIALTFCFVSALRLVAANAAVVTAKAPAGDAKDTVIVVGADAKQMMRSQAVPHDAGHHSTPSPTHTAAPAPGPLAKVSIQLYYESMCPDCVMFINKTLAPLWNNEDLRPHLNLTIFPYGNAMSIPVASISDGYKFWHKETTGVGWDYVHVCQHGSEECLGNMIQACAGNLSSQPKFLELVFCMAALPEYSVEKSSFECMTKVGIDHDKVRKCVNSPNGNRLMETLGEKTSSIPGRKGTPWVMVNGINLQNVSDLMGNTCTHLNFGPHSCKPFKARQQTHHQIHSESDTSDDDFRVFEKDPVQISSKNV